MKIVQLTPGAGSMYCGNCLRDNALVVQWSRLGHDVCMLPLYLPLTLDEQDQSAAEPLFFGGVNVYLGHRIPFLWKYVPSSLRSLLNNRKLLKFLGRNAGNTNPAQVGDLTVSMLRGEHGRQAGELQTLLDWLKPHSPDVVSFSDALLLGMHRRIKDELNSRTVCFLSGEDGFLDALREPFRTQAWELMRNHVREVDVLIAPSRYYAEYIAGRLEIRPETIYVVPNGISLDGFEEEPSEPHETPTLGYFARLSHEKGLPQLVNAYIEIRKRNRIPDLKLKIGGNLNPWNVPLLKEMKIRIKNAGLTQDVSFHVNISREEKIRFLQSLDVFCVPTQGVEPFGFYMIEALAAGVPVVAPDRASFPEIVKRTGGGVLYPENDQTAMVEAIEQLFLDESRRKLLSALAKLGVSAYFTIELAARNVLDVIQAKNEPRAVHAGGKV